jgi:hypothetical protein
MHATARQKHGVAGLHRMDRLAVAQEHGAAGYEMKLRPAFDLAEAQAEGRRDLDATIVEPDKAHAHEQFADEIGLKGRFWTCQGIFGRSIKHFGFHGMARPKSPS